VIWALGVNPFGVTLIGRHPLGRVSEGVRLLKLLSLGERV